MKRRGGKIRVQAREPKVDSELINQHTIRYKEELEYGKQYDQKP
jgi:hypothetical protein